MRTRRELPAAASGCQYAVLDWAKLKFLLRSRLQPGTGYRGLFVVGLDVTRVSGLIIRY